MMNHKTASSKLRRKRGFQGLRLEAPLHSSEWGSCPVLIFSAGFLAEAENLRDIGAVVLPPSILRAVTQGCTQASFIYLF
ncbi:hypothetical protein ARMGADRAFT_286253 [Armillaria gallica]|uniref:Uncharacterized protein n=1 Tax=Armillaria gallica TaxID=47427 RepID=A0A2H3DUD5_ARMGA|nr:hypothetical protein ARMGADRAFT_286253 [Armillaria gallica]